MRLFVFLNPTNKRGTKTAYTLFRKELIKMGFLLVQPEVYMRVVSSRKACNKYLTKMYEKAPSTGCITAYKMTEKQYSSLVYITGEKSDQERIIGANSVIILCLTRVGNQAVVKRSRTIRLRKIRTYTSHNESPGMPHPRFSYTLPEYSTVIYHTDH